MSYHVNYKKEKAPKIGVVTNSIGVFSSLGKQMVEEQFKTLFAHFKEEGVISKDSILYPQRIFGPDGATRVANLFTQERVDLIIVLNSAFPNGNTFLTLVNDPYLSKIPLIITAPLEAKVGIPEWTTNAWCGVIMNNYVAKRLDRYIYPLAGWPKDPKYQDEFKMLLQVFFGVKELRRDLLGRFGDAPGGFHSASGDQLAYAKIFGTRMDTIDWTAVMESYRTRSAKGYRGKVHFNEKEVQETAGEMKKGRLILVQDELIYKASRLYHAFRSIIEANGFTSAAFRCWPEMGEPYYIGVAPCLSIGWLLSKRDITAASCEGDWPTTVTQSIGTLLSGKPAACLDFVNYTGHSPTVQLGHCGVGIAGFMAPNQLGLEGRGSEEIKEKIMSGKIKVNDAIAEKSPERQGGQRVGPAHVGQFQYGVKTGINLIQNKNGKFKMLVFTGENKPKTAKGLLYCAADVEVQNYQRLNELILEHGFSHHLAMTFGDISKELAALCDYYGIEYITPD
jgi:L-fucose isomerase-like protein